MFHQTNLVKSAAIGLPDAIRPADPLQFIQFGAKTLWPAVRGHKWLILTSTFVSLVPAMLFMELATPQYAATTQILVDPTDLRVVDNGVNPSNQVAEVAVIQAESQVRVLTSNNVLRRVLISQHLEDDPEFNRQPSALRKLFTKILSLLHVARAGSHIDPTLASLYELQHRVRVKRADRTYVMDVTVTTADPDKSVRIADAVAQAYLAEQTAARSEAARRASESLQARLSELKDRVRLAEERVEAFKARNNIVGANGQLVNEQQLSELNYQLSLARGRTAEAKSRFEQVRALQRSGADIGAFTEAVQSQTITALRAQYAEVMRREAELMATLGPRHPSVIDVQAQAQRLRRMIGEEINRIAAAAASDYERAKVSEDSLTHSLEALKRGTITTNEARVGLRELERDVQASRAVYESFLVRSRETGEQERLDTKNVRVISQAETPMRRNWPPSSLLVAVGAMIFGVSVGTGLALLREAMSGRKRTPQSAELTPFERPQALFEQRETVPKYPQLAALPGMGSGRLFEVFEDPKSGPAVEIRKLHDMLRGDRKRWSGQSILLAGSDDGGETAALALNLALIAAASQSVLVIDADRRRRAFASIAPDQSRGSLIDVISGQKLLSEAVVRDPRTNINVLPLSGQGIALQGIALQGVALHGGIAGGMKSAFDQAKRFDLVIVAGAGEHDNLVGSAIAALVDQVVLIIPKGIAHKRDIDDIVTTLGSNAGKLRGTVLINARL